jgi:hypothetical protein
MKANAFQLSKTITELEENEAKWIGGAAQRKSSSHDGLIH